MVQEANVKRAQAEKTLAESVMKVGNKFLYFYVSLSLQREQAKLDKICLLNNTFNLFLILG